MEELDAEIYYRDLYKVSQRTGIQGFGNSLIDRRIRVLRRHIHNQQGCWPEKVAELGSSSGEHLDFEPWDSFGTWVGIDLRPGLTDPSHLSAVLKSGRVLAVAGDVEALPFPDDSFDQVVLTCVLHHLSNPEQCLREARRILRPGGTFILAMPTDPGIVNRAIKTLITYPQMKRAGDPRPKLSYAREHRNHVGSLIELLQFTFSEDSSKLSFWPLKFLQSWNLNLIVTFSARKI